jgi:hypothetical protein
LLGARTSFLVDYVREPDTNARKADIIFDDGIMSQRAPDGIVPKVQRIVRTFVA